MTRGSARSQLGIALIGYGVTTIAIFGWGALVEPGGMIVGSSPSSDYQVMTWSLEWWPWAVIHSANPFYTHLVWAPEGFSTGWMTSIPALAALAAPVTLLAGPLTSYNLLMITAPALSALAAFVLCRELAGRFVPALLGGYIFGFSPYVLGQAAAQHLNLASVYALPLIALGVVRFARGSISGRRFVCVEAALLAFQLLVSLEVFATAGLVGLIGIAVAATDHCLRRRLVAVVGRLCVAGLIAVAIGAPIIWTTVSATHPPLPNTPRSYATDAANVLVPTVTTVGGTTRTALDVSARFVGNVGEQDGYLGLPLLVACVIATILEWRRRSWIAAATLIAALYLSLGPNITVSGRLLTSAPVSLANLPLLDNALPSRLAVDVALAAACLVALLLRRIPATRWQLLVAAVLAAPLIPATGSLAGSASETRMPAALATSGFGWTTPDQVADHVVSAQWAPSVPAGATILVLPYGELAPTSYWQAASGMRFRTAEGYTPFVPGAFATAPIVRAMEANLVPPLAAPRLRTFLRSHGVSVVVLAGARARRWRGVAAAATGSRPRRASGVELFRVRPTETPAAPRLPPGLRLLSVPAVDAASPVVSSTRGASPLVAWLAFDGRDARVQALQTAPSPTLQRAATLSSPGADATLLVAAAPGSAEPAFAWTEATPTAVAIRVATGAGDRLSRVTTITGASDVADPEVATLRGGTTVTIWLERIDRRLVLRARRCFANGSCGHAATLAAPSFGVAAARLAVDPTRTDEPTIAWVERDGVGSRLLTASLSGIALIHTSLVATSSTLIGSLRLAAVANVVTVAWTREQPALAAAAAANDGTVTFAATVSAKGIRSTELSPPGAARAGPLLAADGTSVVWRAASGLAAVTRRPNGRWQALPSVPVSSGQRPLDIQTGRHGSVTIVAADRAALVTTLWLPAKGWQRPERRSLPVGSQLDPGPEPLRAFTHQDRSGTRIVTLAGAR